GLSAALRHPEGVPEPRPKPAGPRYCLPSHVEISAGWLHWVDGGGTHCRKFFHDSDALELGRFLPGARLLPALSLSRRLGASLRMGGPVDHNWLVRRLFGDGLPARFGQRYLRYHPASWRRHGSAVFAALVLVAHQRLVRSRGDDQL